MTISSTIPVPSPSPYPGNGYGQWFDPNPGYTYASVYVKYGNGHITPGNIGHFVKPLIFIEGIDFGYDASFKGDISHPMPNVIRNGDVGWCEFWGQSYDISDPTNYLKGNVEFKNSPQFLNVMLNAGYDIMFVDFIDGADFIQRNAMIIVELLQTIQSRQATGGYSFQPSVVIGASMGGQVAKYALSYMEQHGLKHCAREYVSFDSPQKGANIPISLQEWIDFFAHNGRNGGDHDAREQLVSKINRPATRQLLARHYDDGNNYTQQDRIDFQNTMDAIGYPKKMRKVAIADGARDGTSQLYFNNGQQILKTDWTPANCFNRTFIKGSCYAIPNNISFDGTAFKNGALSCLLLGNIGCALCASPTWLFDNSTILHPTNLALWDNAPGGNRNTAEFIAQTFNDAVAGYNGIIGGSATANPLGMPSIPRECFIPTLSALDLFTSNLSLSPINFLQFNNKPLPSQYPFDAYYASPTNQPHVQLEDMAQGANSNLVWSEKEIKSGEPTLPFVLYSGSPNNGVFNMSRFENRLLTSVTIGNGGHLRFNGNIDADFGVATVPYPPNGTNAPIQGSTLEIQTCDCDNIIVDVQNGGIIQLGDVVTANKAIVTIHSGVNFYLRTGSLLIINDNSKLIIEAGATLTIEPGATIELRGPNALFDVKGFLNTVSLNIGEHLYIIRNSTLHGGTIQFSTGAFEMHRGSTLHVDDCKLLFNDVVVSYEHDATFELNDEKALVDIKQPCTINIGNGEIFPVIKGSASTGGTLLLNKGDFNLNTNGIINSNHCKIKLKEYNFHYYENANITLTGEEANLEFGNFIYLHPNAKFYFTGNGYFGFRLSPNWGIYTNVFGDASNTIDIIGSGPVDKIMEVYDNALNTSDEISSFKIRDGLVLLENSGSIGIGNPYELSNLEISSSTSYGGEGIYVGGQTNHLINNVTFRNQNNPFRGYLFWTDGAALSMNNCHFYDCYNGITIYDKSFYISNSTFYNVSNSCIAGSIMSWPSIVYNSTFNQTSYGLDYSSSGLSSLYSNYNHFLAEATAFRYSGYNILSAKCNDAHSWFTAKLDQYATLNVSSLIPPAGYNDFQAIGIPPVSGLPLSSNFDCIQCNLLLIDNGFSSFATGNAALTFSGHVVNHRQSSIVADKNYWHLGSSNGPNSPVNYNLKRGNVGDPPKSILLTDQMPMKGECGIPAEIISNEFSSPLINCSVCPEVNGDYFTNVPLNEAIRQALQETEIGSNDSTGNDTLAFAMLDEILNTSIHYDNDEINYLHAIAYVKIKETLANAVKNGKVDKDLNNIYIDKMISLQSLMIDKENQKDNDVGEFYLTLDLAGTYRLIDDRSKALTVLEDLSVCLELNESQFIFYRKIVNQYTAEKMVVEGLLPIEEFESFLENAHRNELNLLNPRANIDTVIINSAPYSGVASSNFVSDTEGNSYTLSTSLEDTLDYHLIKRNTANNIIWERFYDGWNNGIDSAVALTMDANEFIYVTGKSWNGFDFDIATVKYDTAGIKYWTAIYNDVETGNDVPHAIEIDSSFKVKITASSYNDSTLIYKTIYYSQCDTNCIPSNRISGQQFVNPRQHNFTFAISPNPSDGIFKITIFETGINHHYQMLLYDISGRLLSDQSISNGQNMDFSFYSKGLYFVYLKNELSGIIEKSKVIIQ